MRAEAAPTGAYGQIRPGAWQLCGPEHGLPGGLVAPAGTDEAGQWSLLRPQLLYLIRWPDPAGVPETLGWGNTARVCALLSRRQSAGFLVGQLLGMEPALCQQILLLLWRQGCLQAIAPGGLGEAAAVAPAASDPTPTTPAGSFIVRLWRRLAGLGQH